jgi:predicted PurR-regulated permease PerM
MRPIPWRVIFAVIIAVAGSGITLYLLWQLRRIIAYLIVAAFFAIVLNPIVGLARRRLHLRRSLAAALVFVTAFLLFAALLYAFIRPIVDQSTKFANDLPGVVDRARNGKGPIGHIVKKYKIDDYVQKNQKKLQDALKSAGKPALSIARTVANTVVALVTILVLSFLMLIEGPDMARGALNLLPPDRKRRVEKIIDDCSRAVAGYMFGNVVISVIAGVASFIALFIAHVPFKGVLALWVGFADLIPLVGATLGAVPAVLVAFLHSVPAGIGIIVFFIVYQQFENHVLQVTIMSKTVDLNPLLVLVSVLVGVELFGILGALLSIPAAGIIQVIARDLWDHHQNQPKEEPTIGADEIPVTEVDDGA